MTSLQNLYQQYQQRETTAGAANIAREQEIRGIYGGIIGQYEKGGAARTAGLADIEKTKTRAIGAGTQQMISSGLYGTTTAASIPVQAENQASLSRLKLEDILQQRTTQAKLGLAGFVERIENPYPDYNMLMQAMIAQGAQQGQQRKPMPAVFSAGAPRLTDFFDYWSARQRRMQPGSTAKEQARYRL